MSKKILTVFLFSTIYSDQRYQVTNSGPSLDQLGTKFELTLDWFGISLGSLRRHSGAAMGILWNHFRIGFKALKKS